MSIIPDSLSHLLAACARRQASDLHLSTGAVPTVRVDGELLALDGPPVAAAIMQTWVTHLLSEPQCQLLERVRAIDLGCDYGGHRYRLNIYYTRGALALAARRLESVIPELASLGLPKHLVGLTTLHDGLVLFTGATGSGKSTSLAALLHRINRTRRCHILTIEDPVEYLHRNDRSLIHQRELGLDAPSFAEALRSALREDPDVILVGEMRDLATMRAALTAAETGHLVFSTLHAPDTVGAVDRLLALFPANEQEAVRRQLAMCLRAIVGQRLLPRLDGDGRVPVVELLRNTTAVANLIRNRDFKQIHTLLETGASDGMQSFDAALATLARQRLIDPAIAHSHARNGNHFSERMRVAPRSAAGRC